MKKPVLFYKNLVTIFLLGMLNFLIFPENVSAQGTCTPGSFTTIGNTSVLPTNELQLTPDLQYQKGGIWSNNKATLSQPFDFTVNVFLGDKNNTGADGLCFVLHDDPDGLATIGQDGRGIGACDGDDGDGGIKPSFTIEIDTWQNANLGWTDPANDHIAAHINGDGRHANPSNTILSPVTIDNIEDNAYHAFRVTWNPTTQLIQIYLDGTLKASTNYDLIAYFEGTAVYWGYTASTGDSRNEHKVCPQGTLDATILADDDVYLNADGVTGGTLGNALTNDKLNFAAATTANVTLSVLDPDPSGKVSLNTSTGAITLAAGTPDGVYTVRYQICETASPSNCAYAYIRVDTRNVTQISITPENAWLQQTINRCWTATVLDASNVPVAGITVDFTVSGSPAVSGGSAVTDANGQAEFCYTGPLQSPGFYTHVITATVHGTGINDATNANWYIWSLGSVTLSPLTGTSEINVENAWTALVKDGGCVCGGQNVPPSPLPEQTVSFHFWYGANSGISVPNSTTNSDGIAYFYLTGTNTGYDYFYTKCSKPGYGTKYSENAGFTWTAPVATYPLTYDANGGSGNVPIDASSPYEEAETVTVLGNVGTPTSLSRTGYVFSGWNTQADGNGTTYQAAATFSMPAAAVTLYAIWTPAYPLTYDANTGSGNVPVDANSPYVAAATVTVLGNVGTPAVLYKTGHVFSGWNTQSDGNGTTYQAAATFSMPAAAVTLYAIWTPAYTLTYDANGGTGNVPVDANSPYVAAATVTVLGNVGTPSPLTKTGFAFSGWNTQADGNGTTYQAAATFSMPAAAVTLYAIWTPAYPLTYDANGGTGNVPVDANSPYLAAATVTVLGNVGTPSPLTKTGFAFSGWNTQSDGNGTTYQAAATFSMPAAAVTLYAIWTPAYPLTYDANGGTGNVPVDANSPYLAAATVTVLGNIGAPALTKTGHIFSGWNTLANGSGTTYQAAATFSMPASAQSLYARWLPISTITFDTDGGNLIDPITQVEGTSVTAPPDPTKTGFTFLGWVPAVPENMPVDDVTCVAQWEEIKYQVTYNANGGTGNVPVDANSPYSVGASATILGNNGTPPLAKQFHTFGGWNTLANGSGTPYAAGGTITMTANDVILYAIWTADTYTLTYDANTGTGNVPVDGSSPYVVGASVTILGNVGTPSPLSKTDYTFGGWNTLANGTGTTYAAGGTLTMTANDVVLYALWNPNSNPVTYDANGGTGTVPVDGSSPYTPGSSVTVLGNIMNPPVTKQYHTFGGWNTQANGQGTTYQAGNSFTMPLNAVTLYALWVPDTYSITYDANGGTGNPPSDGNSPYVVGASVTVLGNTGTPAMTKQYHTFGGWNTMANGGGTTYQVGNSLSMPANDVTLYAIWTADTYTVTYDDNGGTGNPPSDGNSPYVVGASVTVLGNTGTPALTKEYHTFGGWNTMANGGGTTYQADDDFTMPENNVILYAIWTADTYTVTYDDNGGTGNPPSDGNSPYVVGASVTVLGNTGTPALTKEYHTFSGWNTMANGGGTTYQVGNSFSMPANDVTLYAIWTADTYTVTYHANGGTGTAPDDNNSPYKVGANVTVLGNIGAPVLTKLYHTFGGWNTQADGLGTTYQAGNNFSMPDNNVTLYAIWTADTYTVTYDANGGTGNVPTDVNSPYTVGASVTVLGNAGNPPLTKPEHYFNGWNTKANGSGTAYQPDDNFTMPAGDVILYAIYTCTQFYEVMVSIRASKMPGNQVKFKAYPINGGNAPYYKWYRADGSGTTLVAEGLNMDEYITTCQGGDEHWVELISSHPCASGNATAASSPLCTF